jgi:hypothetical protein
MMNISKYPEPVVLAGNKVLINATGNKMYLSDGIFGKLNLNFWVDQEIANGKSFTINWGLNSIQIVFRSTLTGNGFEHPSSSAIDYSWVVGFRQFLMSIYAINRDFNIPEIFYFTGDLTILCSLKAKIKSNNYNISVPNNTNTVPVISMTKIIVAGAAPIIRSGYQHIFQLYDISGQLLGEESITPDANQKSVFDLSEYLWNALEINRSTESGFSYPVQEDKIFLHSSHSLHFNIRYAEKWDSTVRQLQAGATCTALMGGVSKIKEAEFATYGTTFSQLLEENKFFLTWQPVTKRTCLKAPERLYFYNDTPRPIYLKFKIYFSDGTTFTTTNPVFLTVQAVAGRVYELDCSAGLFPNPASPIEKYEVWLETSGEERISEIRTFNIDHTFYRNEQHFIFRNSLGGFDTVRCTGRLKRQSEFDRQVFIDNDNERHPLTNLLDANYVTETGSIPADHARWLEDLMLSKEVSWLLNSRAVPVIITSKKMNEITDDQRRFNLSFEFSIASLDSFYSMPQLNDAILGELSGNNNTGNINA